MEFYFLSNSRYLAEQQFYARPLSAGSLVIFKHKLFKTI